MLTLQIELKSFLWNSISTITNLRHLDWVLFVFTSTVRKKNLARHCLSIKAFGHLLNVPGGTQTTEDDECVLSEEFSPYSAVASHWCTQQPIGPENVVTRSSQPVVLQPSRRWIPLSGGPSTYLLCNGFRVHLTPVFVCIHFFPLALQFTPCWIGQRIRFIDNFAI